MLSTSPIRTSDETPWWTKPNFTAKERSKIRKALRATLAFVARAKLNGEAGLLALHHVVSDDDLDHLIDVLWHRPLDLNAMNLLVGRLSIVAPIEEVRARPKANRRAV